MHFKKVIGFVVLGLGAILLVFSYYIAEQVAEGRARVDRAQGQVDTANSLFSLNPTTKQIGKGFTSPIQKKIDEGSLDVSEYTALAHKLQVGGIILIVIGLGALVFWKKR